ncbi:hypothetical protein QJS04_geneDACA022506 [Acorus gramineus]|uniref:PUM-HD domain-containing protein n=1 Tax=Acorus gramineus TaxID=55184 RepID=A0AAV9A074_ACOGR|nr:hypothetical protein QJS04_geneDACA022506 [Acorus gramineus]
MSLSREAYGDHLMYPVHYNDGRGLSFKNPVLTRYMMFLVAVTARLWVPPEDVEGLIYYMVKHQRWCRFLQERFEGVNPDEDDMIFHGVISHVVEFMVDTYGNFLMQKVMEDSGCAEIDRHCSYQRASLFIYDGPQNRGAGIDAGFEWKPCYPVFDFQPSFKSIAIHIASSDVKTPRISSVHSLIQDPYANYVIQTALIVSRGSPHVALVEAIQPHAAVLQSNLYCKRVIQLTLSTK